MAKQTIKRCTCYDVASAEHCPVHSLDQLLGIDPGLPSGDTMVMTEMEIGQLIETVRAGILSQAEFKRMHLGTWVPEENVPRSSLDPKDREEVERLLKTIKELEREGYSEQAMVPMRQMLQRYSGQIAYNDPIAPSVADAIAKLASGSAHTHTGIGGTYIHTFTPQDSTLDGRCRWLTQYEWSQMCAQHGLSGIDLTFERSGSLAGANDNLRWVIRRRLDGQGSTGHVPLTGLEETWEALVIQLQDALEALSYIPEGPYVTRLT